MGTVPLPPEVAILGEVVFERNSGSRFVIRGMKKRSTPSLLWLDLDGR